ncbi:MAG: phytanoyl-CoA dioxygenase family protein [Chloroflexota bacterium]|nr:phytanoyl-CoA dioxygenase family protein [Chloroflexota bacterium]
MFSTTSRFCPRSCGHLLSEAPEHWGELRRSDDIAGDVAALRARMDDDGYLFLPGHLDRELVLTARADILTRLAADGYLAPGTPLMEAVAASERRSSVRSDIARASGPLQALLYSGRMMELYRRFLGGEVLHFDYTWLRPVPPGAGTPPHGDIVFMGRGTRNLYTAWTPLGDIPVEMGGLIVLEGSHRLDRIRNHYGRKDVDAYCSNRPDAGEYASGEKWWGGALGKNPARLRERLGGRWLTADFRAGDLLTSPMFTVHGSLDNGSSAIRLSCDSRYQLASEPADERWVGEDPVGHGPGGKRALIC